MTGGDILAEFLDKHFAELDRRTAATKSQLHAIADSLMRAETIAAGFVTDTVQRLRDPADGIEAAKPAGDDDYAFG
jgi:hypothetical protein